MTRSPRRAVPARPPRIVFIISWEGYLVGSPHVGDRGEAEADRCAHEMSVRDGFRHTVHRYRLDDPRPKRGRRKPDHTVCTTHGLGCGNDLPTCVIKAIPLVRKRTR